LVKDDNCDVLVNSLNILNKWKDYFYRLLNVHGVNDVRLKYIKLNHLSEPRSFQVQIATERLGSVNHQAVAQIMAELIQTEDKT
jgi:hypothetical protein